MRTGFRQATSALVLITWMGTATGCGAPNVSTMTPTVAKPTAVLLLVNQPPHWTVSSVQDLLSQYGIVGDVRNISSSQVQNSLQQVVGNKSIALIAVVQDGPIDLSELDAAKHDIGQRFELIGTQAVNQTAINVRQVVTTSVDTSYALGWLAGQLSMTMGVQSVGWVIDGQSVCTTDQVESALMGAYSANGGFQVTGVTLPPVDPSVPLPKLVVTTRPLSDQEAQTMKAGGVTVLSLCSQSTTTVVARPMLPDMNSLQPDLDAFVKTTWQAGTVTSTRPPYVWTNPDVVTSDLTTNVANVELELQNSPFNVASSWQRIPSQVRQLWSVIPGLTNPVG